MRLSSSLALGLALPALGHPMDNQDLKSRQVDRAGEVKKAFQTSWAGYYKNAFPHDTLRPESNGYSDDRNSWGATAVDALTTAIIMGEQQTVNQILDYIPKIDFTTTKKLNDPISLFESTIRYLGGLISGYDLLTGPYKSLASNSDKVAALLKQAQTLANSLAIAFDTPSGVPDGTIYLNPAPRKSGAQDNSIAGMGTLVLEWTRLSDLTGNQTYARLAQRAEQYLIRPRGAKEPFPGLVGWHVSTQTGEFLDDIGGWGGGTDSFYEYLIKMYLYDPKAFGEYKDRWVKAADSTMEYLASHPLKNEKLTFLSDYSGRTTIPRSGHLASFAGGNFILGGLLLGKPKYLEFGLKLTASYYWTYEKTGSGIGPEGFHWIDSKQRIVFDEGVKNQVQFYKEAGFWVTSPGYILRPETMESLWYAYRATGDSGYRDLAWEAFGNMQKLCRGGSGYSGLRDVTRADGGGRNDFMESFWLAETLKYLYLIFADDSDVQLKPNGKNQFVFNTEAHPIRVRG